MQGAFLHLTGPQYKPGAESWVRAYVVSTRATRNKTNFWNTVKKKKSLKEFECYTREDSLNAKENSNGEQRNKDVKQTKQNEVAKIKINYVKNNINVNGLNNYSKGRTLEKMRSNHTLSNEDTVDSKI